MVGGERVGAAVVLGRRPGDNVGAVVRARASVLAEVELERLNLQQTVGDEARKGRERGGGVVGTGGRGIAELDAWKIRSHKMACDQHDWTDDDDEDIRNMFDKTMK